MSKSMAMVFLLGLGCAPQAVEPETAQLSDEEVMEETEETENELPDGMFGAGGGGEQAVAADFTPVAVSTMAQFGFDPQVGVIPFGWDDTWYEPVVWLEYYSAAGLEALEQGFEPAEGEICWTGLKADSPAVATWNHDDGMAGTVVQQGFTFADFEESSNCPFDASSPYATAAVLESLSGVALDQTVLSVGVGEVVPEVADSLFPEDLEYYLGGGLEASDGAFAGDSIAVGVELNADGTFLYAPDADGYIQIGWASDFLTDQGELERGAYIVLGPYWEF